MLQDKPKEFKALSMCRIEVVARLGYMSGYSAVTFPRASSGKAHSMRKLARTCTFIEDHGWLEISNLLSLIAHFVICFKVYGHYRMALSGWLVKIIIECAWK